MPWLDQVIETGTHLNTQGAGFLMTPLHWAVFFRRPAAVRALLQVGANPNIPSEDGSTPIHWALMTGQTDVVLMLLAHPDIRFTESAAGRTGPREPIFQTAKRCVLENGRNWFPVSELILQPDIRTAALDAFRRIEPILAKLEADAFPTEPPSVRHSITLDMHASWYSGLTSLSLGIRTDGRLGKPLAAMIADAAASVSQDRPYLTNYIAFMPRIALSHDPVVNAQQPLETKASTWVRFDPRTTDSVAFLDRLGTLGDRNRPALAALELAEKAGKRVRDTLVFPSADEGELVAASSNRHLLWAARKRSALQVEPLSFDMINSGTPTEAIKGPESELMALLDRHRSGGLARWIFGK